MRRRNIVIGTVGVAIVLGIVIGAAESGGTSPAAPQQPADPLTAAQLTTTPVTQPPNAVQVYLRDMGLPDTDQTEQSIYGETPLICNLYTSGVPMSGDNRNAVHALNDSGLCGRTNITVPPTAWPTY